MNAQFKKRLESFLWRTGMMVLAVFIAFILENLSLLELTPLSVTLVGLVLGELSKFINTQLVGDKSIAYTSSTP